MSRHYFDCAWNGQPIRITVGYNRPLKNFFLHIAWLDAKSGTVVAYASELGLAYDPNDLKTIRRFLDRLNLATPSSLWTEVASDGQQHLGNRVAEHFSDGRIRELYG